MTLPLVKADFETLSAADLKLVGGRNYALHPSTKLLLGSFELDGRRVDVVDPGRPLPGSRSIYPFPELEAGQFEVVMHNSRGFDRFIWSALDWPEPLRVHDTAEIARRAGYPMVSLDYLGTAMLGRPKDDAGSWLVKDISAKYAARYGGSKLQTAFDFAGTEEVLLTPEVVERIRVYCNADLDILVGIWPELSRWLPYDAAAHAVYCAMQDRGIAFDVELARALLELDERLAREARERARVTDPSGIRSNQRFLAKLREYGIDLPNAQKKTLSQAYYKLDLNDPIEAMAGELIKARQAGTTIAGGKLRAGLARVSPDGRLRDNNIYCGAHTWRASGKGMQLQNLPKGDDLPEVFEVRKADALARGLPAKKGKVPGPVIDKLTEERIRRIIAREPGATDGLNAKHVNTLTRACLKASDGNMLVISDFAGVEARFLAWAANDVQALEDFRVGVDTYKKFIARILKKAIEVITDEERQVGKVSELGLGYQMGEAKFAIWLAMNGVDVAALESELGLTPGMIVQEWRTIHDAIVQFWYDTQDAAKRAARGETVVVGGRFTWRKKGQHVACVLPSGRPVVYQRMAVVWWERRGNTMSARMPDGTWASYTVPDSDQRRSGEGLVYLSRRGWQSTHGGKLVENIVQACCRDLLFEDLVLLEKEELNPVHDIHDEVVEDVPAWMSKSALAITTTVMSAAHIPTWAEGMPLASEGFQTYRYRK